MIGRRDTRRFKAEADRLHDEIWELREAAAARDRAQAASEAKSRFLANVSHEVRTPLNGILGMAELLAGTPLDAEQATYVAAIRSSGSALASLIDEILDFSKIEAGRVELAVDSFDLVALVEGVAELLAPRAQGKSLEIASTLAADVPQHVIGDPVRLRQILLNLAGNAIKFTETGGVGLRVRRMDDTGSAIRFDVIDTGPGVPPERRIAIFEEFEQADSTTTRLHGGTGLGLAISRRLAERMGGTLDLQLPAHGDMFGMPDERGSIFTVVLPLQPDHPGGSGPATATPSSLRGTSALIVAASPFEAPFMAERLAEAGVVVACAVDEAEALRQLRSAGRFDIVIVDCALGRAATHAVGEAARLAGVGQRIVLFSPFERRAFGQMSSAGFDGWLVKPVRKQSLFTLLDPTAARLSPSAAAAGVAEAAIRHAGLPVPAPGFDVLLAEDNEINALLATRHLERLGASVTRAPDGLTALALVEAAMDGATPYDMVLLDIRMPGLDGIEVARRIRLAESARQVQPTRLIALSADVHDAERRSGCRAGIDEFLSKPVTFARLERALGREPASVL